MSNSDYFGNSTPQQQQHAAPYAPSSQPQYGYAPPQGQPSPFPQQPQYASPPPQQGGLVPYGAPNRVGSATSAHSGYASPPPSGYGPPQPQYASPPPGQQQYPPAGQYPPQPQYAGPQGQRDSYPQQQQYAGHDGGQQMEGQDGERGLVSTIAGGGVGGYLGKKMGGKFGAVLGGVAGAAVANKIEAKMKKGKHGHGRH